MLPQKLSEVTDEFDLSTSSNFIAPSSPILLPVLSENETSNKSVLLRSIDVRDKLDLIASDSAIAPSLPM
jgi:hypothetical protein